MKKTIIAAAVAAATMSTVAMAQTPASTSSAYVSLEGGLNLPKGNAGDEQNKGFDLGLSAGYRMGMFQGELEYMFIRNSYKAGGIDAGTIVWANGKIHETQNAFMANAGIVYPMSQLKLKAMVGLGMVHASIGGSKEVVDQIHSHGYTTSTNAFAMQGIVGAEYMLNDNIGLGADYHLLTWKKDGARIYNNMINANISYSFAA